MRGELDEEETNRARKTVKEMLEAIPRARRISFLGHFKELMIFLNACENALREEAQAARRKARGEEDGSS